MPQLINMASYQRIADEIRSFGAELSEMRRHREELEMKRVEKAKLEEEAKKAAQETSVPAENPASDASSQILSQKELLSMTPKELQTYMSEVQRHHDTQREAQLRESRQIGWAAAAQTEKYERQHYEAQMREYKRNLNGRRTIERLLQEQKNLP